MMTPIERAFTFGEALFGLGRAIFQAVRAGKAERLSSIIPDELLTTIERKRAEAEALARYEGGEGDG